MSENETDKRVVMGITLVASLALVAMMALPVAAASGASVAGYFGLISSRTAMVLGTVAFGASIYFAATGAGAPASIAAAVLGY